MNTGAKVDNFARLFAKDEDTFEGEVFDFVYRGSSEIDRHYTKPMLPWIISEIKNQHKLLQVCIIIFLINTFIIILEICTILFIIFILIIQSVIFFKMKF